MSNLALSADTKSRAAEEPVSKRKIMDTEISKSNDTALANISMRIDQHIKFMDSMEQIRWRFTSAFGITALLTILFLSARLGVDDPIEKIIAYTFAVLISLSGLITQVRIIGLFWGQWHKIRILQDQQLRLLGSNEHINDEVISCWKFPPIEAPVTFGKVFFTVHGVNCLLFSALSSGALTLLVKNVLVIQSTQVLIVAFISFFIIIKATAVKYSKVFINKGLQESG